MNFQKIPKFLDHPFNLENNEIASSEFHKNLKTIASASSLRVAEDRNIVQLGLVEWIFEHLKGVFGYVDHLINRIIHVWNTQQPYIEENSIVPKENDPTSLPILSDGPKEVLAQTPAEIHQIELLPATQNKALLQNPFGRLKKIKTATWVTAAALTGGALVVAKYIHEMLSNPEKPTKPEEIIKKPEIDPVEPPTIVENIQKISDFLTCPVVYPALEPPKNITISENNLFLEPQVPSNFTITFPEDFEPYNNWTVPTHLPQIPITLPFVAKVPSIEDGNLVAPIQLEKSSLEPFKSFIPYALGTVTFALSIYLSVKLLKKMNQTFFGSDLKKRLNNEKDKELLKKQKQVAFNRELRKAEEKNLRTLRNEKAKLFTYVKNCVSKVNMDSFSKIQCLELDVDTENKKISINPTPTFDYSFDFDIDKKNSVINTNKNTLVIKLPPNSTKAFIQTIPFSKNDSTKTQSKFLQLIIALPNDSHTNDLFQQFFCFEVSQNVFNKALGLAKLNENNELIIPFAEAHKAHVSEKLISSYNHLKRSHENSYFMKLIPRIALSPLKGIKYNNKVFTIPPPKGRPLLFFDVIDSSEESTSTPSSHLVIYSPGIEDKPFYIRKIKLEKYGLKNNDILKYALKNKKLDEEGNILISIQDGETAQEKIHDAFLNSLPFNPFLDKTNNPNIDRLDPLYFLTKNNNNLIFEDPTQNLKKLERTFKKETFLSITNDNICIKTEKEDLKVGLFYTSPTLLVVKSQQNTDFFDHIDLSQLDPNKIDKKVIKYALENPQKRIDGAYLINVNDAFEEIERQKENQIKEIKAAYDSDKCSFKQFYKIDPVSNELIQMNNKGFPIHDLKKEIIKSNKNFQVPVNQEVRLIIYQIDPKQPVKFVYYIPNTDMDSSLIIKKCFNDKDIKNEFETIKLRLSQQTKNQERTTEKNKQQLGQNTQTPNNIIQKKQEMMQILRSELHFKAFFEKKPKGDFVSGIFPRDQFNRESKGRLINLRGEKDLSDKHMWFIVSQKTKNDPRRVNYYIPSTAETPRTIFGECARSSSIYKEIIKKINQKSSALENH